MSGTGFAVGVASAAYAAIAQQTLDRSQTKQVSAINAKPVPTNCVNCGATIGPAVCEYCGTVHGRTTSNYMQQARKSDELAEYYNTRTRTYHMQDGSTVPEEVYESRRV